MRDGQIIPAVEQCRQADLILALGSTLQVTPAANLCKTTNDLILCNRQETDMDRKATVRLFGDCDDFMSMLLSKMMGVDAFEQWVGGERSARMMEYNNRRRFKKDKLT